MLINWHDNYSIHNEKIDEQHKKLFALARKAYLMANQYTTREEIKETLWGFFEYMKEHFADEEAYMESIGYPDLEEHKKLHKYIIQQLSITIQNIKTVNEMKEKLNIIAQEWLLNHILYEDMLIEKYRAKISSDAKDVNSDRHKERPVDSAPEQKEKPEKKEGYYYRCGCPGMIHVIPKNIHISIKKKGEEYQCGECGQTIIYTGRYYFN